MSNSLTPSLKLVENINSGLESGNFEMSAGAPVMQISHPLSNRGI
jgi:hypothetical protein